MPAANESLFPDAVCKRRGTRVPRMSRRMAVRRFSHGLRRIRQLNHSADLELYSPARTLPHSSVRLVRTLSAEVLTRRESRRTGQAIWLDLAGSASRRHRARDVKPMFSPPPGRWRRGAFRPPASSNRHWVFWKPGGGPTIHCDAVCKLKTSAQRVFSRCPSRCPGHWCSMRSRKGRSRV
jgi:hypothetical protein